jgi:hypothetical protein
MIYQLTGVGLVIVGILIVIYGDKMVDAQQSAVGKAVSMPPGTVKLVKWVVAVLLVWFGAALIIEGGPL